MDSGLRRIYVVLHALTLHELGIHTRELKHAPTQEPRDGEGEDRQGAGPTSRSMSPVQASLKMPIRVQELKLQLLEV